MLATLTTLLLVTRLLDAPAPAVESDLSTLEAIVTHAEGSAESQSQLEDGIAAFEAQGPALVDDRPAHDVLHRARLALVWVHLMRGQQAQAEAAMDEVIRSAMSDPIQDRYGPVVFDLYKERLALLQTRGTSTIETSCDSCVLVINEHSSLNPSGPLFLGTYRVWLIPGPGQEPEPFEVELSTADRAARVEPRVVDQPEVGGLDLPDQPKKRRDRRRLLPRWASLAGVGVGVGLMVIGGALNSLNYRCTGGSYDTDRFEVCPFVYYNHPQDYVLLTLGALTSASFGAVLTVDEVRHGKAKGRQATLTWTLRF